MTSTNFADISEILEKWKSMDQSKLKNDVKTHKATIHTKVLSAITERPMDASCNSYLRELSEMYNTICEYIHRYDHIDKNDESKIKINTKLIDSYLMTYNH